MIKTFWIVLASALFLQLPLQARPVELSQRSLAGVRAQVLSIDLSDPQTRLDILLANRAPLANNHEKQFGDESFGSMVSRAKAAAVVNGTFFSKDAQKRVMGNLVRGGIFAKYSRWENFGTSFGLNARNQPDMFTIRAGDQPRWEQHWFSLTCGPRLLKDGAIWLAPKTEGFQDPHVLNRASRAALGYSRDGKTLYLVSFLSPLTLQQAAAAMQALGAYQAMNLDGGASKGLAFSGRVLQAPGRHLTNAIAVYDSRFPAPAALTRSQQGFEIARLPNGDLPVLSPETLAARSPQPLPTPTPTAAAVAKPVPQFTASPAPPQPTASTPALPDPETDPVARAALAAPKYFFWYLHTQDFPAAWRVLTEASRQAIVAEIVASIGDPQTYSKAYVRQAMDSHQANFAPAFWQTFRQSVDSEKWIKSHFVLTALAAHTAEVQVQPGQIPLAVRYEAGGWRFGFAESFY